MSQVIKVMHQAFERKQPRRQGAGWTYLGMVLSLLVASSTWAQAPSDTSSASDDTPKASVTPSEVVHTLDEPGLVDVTVVGGVSDRGSPRLSVVATGDLNGDGRADLAIGAPGFDPNGVPSAGSVYVIFGRVDGLLIPNASRDLGMIDAFDMRIDGVEAGSQLGAQVAIADVDDDGIDDLIMSAPGGIGHVYVRRGGANWPRALLSVAQDGIADLILEGDHPGSLLGATLCAGDLNRDGNTDLVFGGLEFGDQGRTIATALYVIPGRSRWARRRYSMSDRIPGRVRLFRPIPNHSRAMHVCALGNLDDDEYGDVVAGMPLESGKIGTSVGSVAVVRNVLAQGTGSIDLGAKKPTWGSRLIGDRDHGRFGYALAVGDFNGDGRDDLAVGAPDRVTQPPVQDNDAPKPRPEGAVFIFWGGRETLGSGGRADQLLVGAAGHHYGHTLEAVDLNADKRSDLLVGAPQAQTFAGPRSGFVDIYLGSGKLYQQREEREEPTMTIPLYDLRLVGSVSDTRLGYAAAAGDLDGDGTAELVLRNASNARGRVAAGSVSVISRPLEQGVDASLDAVGPLTLLGPGRGGRLASTLINKDLNGDGQRDMVWLSPEGAGFSGVVCVQLSGGALDAHRSPGTVQSMQAPATCDRRIVAPTGARIAAVDAGDFNGDGRIDMVLGLDDHRVNGEAMGAVVVVPWFDAPLVSLDDANPEQWWWLGGPGAEGLGSDVRFGDLDSDGVDELIIAANRATYDDHQHVGALLVVRGDRKLKYGRYRAAEGEHVWYRFEGSDAGSGIGPGSRVLDFDGDGVMDLLVMAPHAMGGARVGAGVAYLIYNITRLDSGDHQLVDKRVAPLRIVGPSERSHLEHRAVRQDLDGDGLDDLLFQAPYARHGGITRGAVYVIYGRRERIGRVVDLALDGSSDLMVRGTRSGGPLIGPAVGDLNGDGALDLVVSSKWASTSGYRETGRVFVLLATPGKVLKGRMDLTQRGQADVMLRGVETHAGLVVPEALPDTDQDGRSELWLVSPFADDVQSDQGKALRVSERLFAR